MNMFNAFEMLDSLATMIAYEDSAKKSGSESLGPWNFNEITALAIGLKQKNIPFTQKRAFDGWQIICDDWDAILHCGSYGHSAGLLEIYGSIVRNEDDDVEGYLTATEILSRL